MKRKIKGDLILRINPEMLSLTILLCTATSKWFFEDILTMSILEPFCLMIGVCVLLFSRKTFSVTKNALWWVLYMVSILFNLALHGAAFNIWGRAFIVVFTAAYALLLDCNRFDIKKAVAFVFRIGVFHALMVFVHFVLKDKFNSLYFPLLAPGARDYATVYFRNGYYFGILDSPHEVAGIISFALIASIFSLIVIKKRSKKVMVCFIILFLAAALLLTQKKGVIFCLAASVVFSLLLIYASKKQLHKVLLIVIIGVLGAIILRAVIMANPDVALFKRLNEFLTGLTSGETVDGGRSVLYGHALDFWRESPITGIGWRSFKGLTTEVLGYRLAHEVNCDYLQWLCEMGLLGIVLNFTPILITLYRAFYVSKRVIRNLTDLSTKWVILFSVCVQFFILMYAVVEIPFYDIMFFAVYMLSCIFINHVYHKERYKEHSERLSTRLAHREAGRRRAGLSAN